MELRSPGAAWIGAALSTAALVSSAGAGVHVVGSGETFAQISAAVAAAQDGDTILVESGWYAPFTVDGKGLTIVAEAGATVTIGVLGLVPQRSTVRALTANQTVVIRGIDGPFLLFGNAGAVRLEDCAIVGEPGDCSPLGCQPATAGVEVIDSASVAITRCAVTGGAGDRYVIPPFDLCIGGGPGLRVAGSTTVLYDTSVAGGAGAGACGAGPATDATPGAVVDGLAPQHRFAATSPLRKAQLGSLEFAGQAGDLPILLITAGPDLVLAPQYQGALLVGPISGVAVLGALPASGTSSIPLFVGDLPPAGTHALDLHLQAAYATGGGFVLADASVVTMLDPSF